MFFGLAQFALMWSGLLRLKNRTYFWKTTNYDPFLTNINCFVEFNIFIMIQKGRQRSSQLQQFLISNAVFVARRYLM